MYLIDFIIGITFLVCAIAIVKHILRKDLYSVTMPSSKLVSNLMTWCVIDKFRAF